MENIYIFIICYCIITVLRDLDQHISDDDEKRIAKLRIRTVQEICMSETNYIHQLDKLITVSTTYLYLPIIEILVNFLNLLSLTDYSISNARWKNKNLLQTKFLVNYLAMLKLF